MVFSSAEEATNALVDQLNQISQEKDVHELSIFELEARIGAGGKHPSLTSFFVNQTLEKEQSAVDLEDATPFDLE